MQGTDRLGSEIMDTRDLIERAREIAAELEDESLCEDPDAYREELAEIETIEAEVPDYQYGEGLIREDYFTEYAQELAEDIGAIGRDAQWPLSFINWEAAATALKMDYTQVEYQGNTYFARA